MASPSGTDQAQAQAPFRFQQEGPFVELPSGAMIIARTVIWGVAPPEFDHFIGTIMAMVEAVDPQTGQIKRGQVPIQFGIEAEDIDQAFERFRETAEQAGRAWVAARNKPKILVASKIPTRNGQMKIGGQRFDFGGGA